MIPVTTLNVHIRSEAPFDFGANPGSSIRGALYEALRVMYDTQQPVQSREDETSNPVAWLLALEDPDTTGGKDVPRPIAVRPPLGDAGTATHFGLSFYGRGRAYIPMVLSAVQGMSRIGVGRGRHPFTVTGIDAVDPLTGQATRILEGTGRTAAPLPEPPTEDAYQRFAGLIDGEALQVTFLTPTRIVDKGRLCPEAEFRPWVQRLLERTRTIGELYTEEPPWVPFKTLLAAANKAKIAQASTRWVEAWSGSRRQHARRPTSGFVGQVTYQNVAQELLPWLLLGQALQVGKHTIKGCGWYQLAYVWKS